MKANKHVFQITTGAYPFFHGFMVLLWYNNTTLDLDKNEIKDTSCLKEFLDIL